MNDEHVDRLAKLIREKNRLDEEISAVTGRPALIGHLVHRLGNEQGLNASNAYTALKPLHLGNLALEATVRGGLM